MCVLVGAIWECHKLCVNVCVCSCWDCCDLGKTTCQLNKQPKDGVNDNIYNKEKKNLQSIVMIIKRNDVEHFDFSYHCNATQSWNIVWNIIFQTGLHRLEGRNYLQLGMQQQQQKKMYCFWYNRKLCVIFSKNIQDFFFEKYINFGICYYTITTRAETMLHLTVL